MKTTDGMGRAELLARIDELEAQKNGAYAERDRCVALIAAAARKLGHPVGFAEHSPDDASWDREWRNIVFVELPTGQVSWHIHDSEKPWFAELGAYMTPWDGHTTEEKYARVAETARQWFADVFDHEALERATADYAERVAGLNAAIDAAKTPAEPMTLSERTHWIRVEWAAGFVARRAELATSESLRMRIDTLGEILGEDFQRETAQEKVYAEIASLKCDVCGSAEPKLAKVYCSKHLPPSLLQPGEEVEIVDGMSRGMVGKVISFVNMGETVPVRILEVEIAGYRTRHVREDFMRRRESESSAK